MKLMLATRATLSSLPLVRRGRRAGAEAVCSATTAYEGKGPQTQTYPDLGGDRPRRIPPFRVPFPLPVC
eukprot:scaffold11929_cov107-Isochrysis_galbana.AAC.16